MSDEADGLTGLCRGAKDYADPKPFHRECHGNKDIHLPHQRAGEPPALPMRCSCACHLVPVPACT